MKKALLVLLVSFTIANFSNNKAINMDKDNEIEHNAKRNYNYLYYNNSDNYTVKNQDDIRMSIYNGLNEGKSTITLYCAYDNNDDCLNDFYKVYKNKSLMSSINNYVSPYNKYASTRYHININNGEVKISLDIDKKYTQEEIDEIDETVDNYLNQLSLDDMSDVEKIKWAHDFIINKNTYDEEALKVGTGDAYSAYGAIIGNKAICRGYAEAMAIFLDKFNIPNIMISSGTHVWNLVNVDGKWLHLDTTWDDPILTSGKETKRYDYYLISTEQLNYLDNSYNHSFNSNYYKEA